MAKPATKNIEIYCGDDFELYLRIRTRIWDPDTNTWVPGPYRDLTGYTNGGGQVRKTREDTTVLAPMTVEFDDQTDPDTKGGLFLRIARAATAVIEPTTDRVKWVWDFQLTNTDDKVKTYATGSAAVTKDVTRA